LEKAFACSTISHSRLCHSKESKEKSKRLEHSYTQSKLFALLNFSMSLPVYRNGAWIHYTLPETGIQLWSQSQKLKAASVYATARTQGHSKETSAILAECFVNKELYGVAYSPAIEKHLEQLVV
jgi:hypothetical protein